MARSAKRIDDSRQVAGFCACLVEFGILGYDAREGWSGWDQVEAHMPQAEIRDMIVELRSLTMGVGSFEWRFDHLQELSGRIADDIVKIRAEQA